MANSLDGPLAGLRILVVEDDYLQADGITVCLAEAGATIAGLAANIAEATAFVESNAINAAVIDINLGDGPSFELANHLLQAGLPFLFVTGYQCAEIPWDFRGITCIEKPFSEEHLIQAVAEIASAKR